MDVRAVGPFLTGLFWDFLFLLLLLANSVTLSLFSPTPLPPARPPGAATAR